MVCKQHDTHPRQIEAINAVTLPTHDMAQALGFYRALGFHLHHGGETAPITTFGVGATHLNLCAHSEESQWSWPGRIIFYVADVDALYTHVLSLGMRPDTSPRDAEWGERYFHIKDPDGHELSFAQPLQAPSST